jgi:two-component system KDP operon response regulator KdpE
MTKILLVDDDPQLLKLLGASLQQQGFEVLTHCSDADALRMIHQAQPDLIVTGLRLPGFDGVKLCKRLRERTDVPILVLSAISEEQTMLRAFDAGADDYVIKPYSTVELIARIRAHLRTYARACAERVQQEQTTLQVGDLRIDTLRRQVTVRGNTVELTPTEYELLLCLARHQDQVVDHRKLLSDTWGPECADQLEYLRLYVRALRCKVEANPANPQLIKTMRGVGYYLAA